MAIHSSLGIYGAVTDLLGVALETAKVMPRDVKLLAGKPIVDRCIEMTTVIRRANQATDKVPHLERLLDLNEQVEVLLRVSVEKGYIRRGQYGKAILLSQSVGRQAGGWRKSSSTTPVTGRSRPSGQSDIQPGPAARPQGDRHAR